MALFYPWWSTKINNNARPSYWRMNPLLQTFLQRLNFFPFPMMLMMVVTSPQVVHPPRPHLISVVSSPWLKSTIQLSTSHWWLLASPHSKLICHIMRNLPAKVKHSSIFLLVPIRCSFWWEMPACATSPQLGHLCLFVTPVILIRERSISCNPPYS